MRNLRVSLSKWKNGHIAAASHLASNADACYQSDEVAKLIQAMQLPSSDGDFLRNLADDAVAYFESDVAAISWFEAEIKNRRPKLWRSIKKWVARRSS